MPATTRHRMPAAVIIGCLTALAAPAVPAGAAPPPVTVAVTTDGSDRPSYRIQVRNAGRAPVDTTVRQALPAGVAPTAISGGGRATLSTGRAMPYEVTWQLRLPASSTTTLSTATTPARPGSAMSAPTCAFAQNGTTPYDCATATWKNGAPPPVAARDAPAWGRPPALIGAFVAVALMATGAGWWWQRRRRRAANAYPTPTAVPDDPGAARRARRGTIYPRPSVPQVTRGPRRPPVWLVTSGAGVLLAGVLGAAGWTATNRVGAIQANRQPTGGAWVGRTAVGAVGAPLRDAAFEFTVYRISCPAASAPTRQCQATVGVRNLTPEDQLWYGPMQRAYLPDHNWVSTDERATRAANEGRDVFAAPVPAHGRLLVPLVFTVTGREPPTQLELRSGVFSAGVRVDVT